MTTVPEPLSADLMTMSLRLLSSLQAFRSRAVKLSRTGAGATFRRSCSTASRKVSRAGSLEGGGVQVLLGRNVLGLVWGGWSSKYSRSLIRRLNSLKSALTSVQSMLRGVGQNERPLESNCVSSWVRVTVLKLIIALVSSWMLWLSRLQYLLVVNLRLRRRLCLCVGEGWLIAVQYVAQFSYGSSFRTKRTLFDYFRRSFKSSLIKEYRK